MKISPESFIVDEGLCLKYKSIFISGNDENYIYSLLNLLVSNFTKNGYVRKNLNENKDMLPDLFGARNKHGICMYLLCGAGHRSRGGEEHSNGAFVLSLKLSALLNHNCESRLVALSSCYVFYHSKSQ